MRWLLLSYLLAIPGLAHAQGLASLEALRSRAAARGWTEAQGTEYGHPIETWCAAPPCGESDRYELTLVDGALVQLRLILRDAADGFSLDASWQASGAFGFRFAHGESSVDLTWELGFEPPGLSVGFTTHDLDDMVALDPSDGEHAFALWIARELDRTFVSATSLRDTALAQRAALRRAVVSGLAHSATVREGSLAECMQERSFPSGATGFFDTCPMRMATADEQRGALAALDARLRSERAILRAHFRAFHRVLRAWLAGD